MGLVVGIHCDVGRTTTIGGAFRYSDYAPQTSPISYCVVVDVVVACIVASGVPNDVGLVVGIHCDRGVVVVIG